MKTRSLNTLCLAIISSFTLPAMAAESEETMVVTASGFQQVLRNAPASISVVTREQLEKKPFHNLGDAVKDVEGVSITGSGTNSQDISIRGLPGDYTLILVDGKRQNSRESRPNGNGGFESGFIPPMEAIERIEVIRGPMSSLYGSDAMGGVINIITRKVGSDWNGAVSMDATLQENSDSGNIYAGNFYLSGPLVENRVGFQLYGYGNYRPEDDIIEGYNENDNKGVTAKLSFTPTDTQQIILEGGRAIQKRESTPGKSIEAYTVRGSLKQPNPKTNINNERNHWALTHTGQWDFGFSDISVYQEKTKRSTETHTLDSSTGSWNGGYSDRKPEITNTVVDAKLTLPLPSNMVTIGGQYQYSELNDDSTTGRTTAEKTDITAWQKSVFIEDEIALLDDLTFTGGVRLDDHETYGDYWNPRGYLVYHLTDEITLKGGVAKAFRAPTLREISPDYGTATQGGAGIMYGNPDLKPETSVNQEIGIAYDHESGFNAALTLFNTDFKNKLTSYSTGGKDPITGLNLYTYDNVGKANIKGVEAATTIPLVTNWILGLNYTYLDSKRKSDDEFFTSGESLKGQPLAQTPKHSANAKLTWTVNDDLETYTRVTYTGKQVWAAQRNSYTGPRYRDGFTTVDVGGSYQINKNTQLNLAVLNITDETGDDINTNGGNWIVEDGRRYWAGINVKF
ncbi:TonB-dependent receptor domain-containing protein [Limnobaculum xujianqingii]|uniref:TonB-dependent receptor domain-containing protein n=1 Tax=Limnobaculum xujianqingii TaxID=2738837 RepID=UPI00112DB356|nr:TonB-dependent receptor [Limnobaculum xujianqingii]